MKKIVCLEILLSLTFMSSTVFAATIDFESATTAGLNVTNGGTTEGFTLGSYNGTTGGGFNSTLNTSYVSSAHSGNQYMLNYNSVYGEFSSNVGAVTVNRIWAANPDFTSADVSFLGLDEFGIVQHSLTTTVGDWTEVIFSGWDNVTSFRWDPTNPDVTNIAIDDFT